MNDVTKETEQVPQSLLDEATLSAKKDGEVSADQVYNWLTRYYLHQDQLSWSRIQVMVAVEASTLAATFFLDGKKGEATSSPWSSLALLLGSALILVLWLLVLRDWIIRDQDIDKLDALHKKYGIRMTRQGWWWQSGWYLGWILFVIILIANGGLGILLLRAASLNKSLFMLI